MKRTLLSRLLVASLLASAAFVASAQSATTSVSVDAQAQPVAEADASAISSTKPEIDRNCLRNTGSRIGTGYNTSRNARERTDKAGQRCVAATGRVYSREDLDRTGEIDIADALRKLDPAIR